MELSFYQYQQGAVGDYIFLILIVLASIAQAFSQRKKKVEEQAQRHRRLEKELEETDEAYERQYEEKEQPAGSFFDQMEKMFDPDLPEDEPEPVRKSIIIEKKSDIESKKEELKKMQTSLSSYITDEEHNAEIQKEYPGKSPMLPTKEIESLEVRKRIREGFNLKKAVIYSEVLNRKYF